MDDSLVGLLNLLEDEFRNDEVRISPIFQSGTERAMDLPQDYDAETNNTHREAGVKVATKRREFFFPQEWLSEKTRIQIHRQIDEIRELLGR